MRGGALVVLVAVLASCTPVPQGAPSPQPLLPPQSAGLRIQLDLLLTEHVMIVAKESAAAINRSDDYAAYTAALATNEDALTRLVRAASGNTAATGFAQAWSAVNSDLVDYAIRIATHDGDKADADTSHLTDASMPALSSQLAGLTFGQQSDFLANVTTEITGLRDAIDGEANHQYAALYISLETALSVAMTIGDSVAAGLVRRFPDKFPGDQSSPDVVRTMHLNVFLQERAYLTTMLTAAQLDGRTGETPQALGALSTNLNLIVAEVRLARSRQAWLDELTSIQRYAGTGDSVAKSALTETFVAQLASLMGVSPGIVSNQVNATIQVIDDQRTKKFDDVAGDDRAAATSMQPIADSL